VIWVFTFSQRVLITKAKLKSQFLDFSTDSADFLMGLVWLRVFNATFNNISAISWQSDLLVEETRVPGENHQPVASH